MFYDELSNIKLGDFGLTLLREDDSPIACKELGTPRYAAPEVLTRQKFDEKSDIYSFGLMMFEVMFETRVFQEFRELKILKDAVCKKETRPIIPNEIIQKTEARQRAQGPEKPPPEFTDLMQQCWSPDPTSRPSIAQVIEQLNMIILRRICTNGELLLWWRDNFMRETFVDEVPFGTFCEAISMSTGLNQTVFTDLHDIFCVKFDTHENTDNIVQLRHIDLMSSWFGPFFTPHGAVIVAEITTLSQQPWFHWDVVSSIVAERRLLHRKFKTFLVRMSFRNPQKEPFTLSVLSEKNSADHHRIYLSEPGSKGKYCIDIPGGKMRIEFDHLAKLIESQLSKHKSSFFILSNPCEKGVVVMKY